MMPITLNQPDGLHLSTEATLAQLLEDETLRTFADGLLCTALVETCNLQPGGCKQPATQRAQAACNLSLAEALHDTGGMETYPLLTALLALDAEVHSLIDDERRVLPLPAFLSYRDRLPLDKVPPETVRLPPLNSGGRYAFSVLADGGYLAVRLDLHDKLRVAGHVRIALSSPTHPPLRLHTIEDRLERQVIKAALIEAALAGGKERLTISLTPVEQAALIEALNRLVI
ncbi:MAG: hypothetical protein HYR94_09250 [Chloroflexi bacterium]|nr:hypothetical protein [Chloroflexota bacterium]